MEDQKQVIPPIVLEGKNYLLWSRTTKTLLRSCGLWVHCLSSHETPKGIDEAGSGKGGVKTSAQISSSLGDSKVDPRRSACVGYSSKLFGAEYPCFLLICRESKGIVGYTPGSVWK
ncbi:hypothetical protein V5N11_015535 [Cardamine amara subsp. amara]|uniref:Retrotransposon Copia-like N-terminal domain-containing protein n=1 Tax=Cardamine amara subsp. amara TaxID=228776 RepID=A0ABD0Z5Y0_CARAN